ncbi:MAG: aminoglycoside phosphotransferase family protein, partial [Planctomycetes bacterium]|nr:aminoglycoside phosphotransferase family protein [Planctomycetota bacterium]
MFAARRYPSLPFMAADDTPQRYAAQFALPSKPTSIVDFPGGHINDSYLVHCSGVEERFLLQRVNGEVFPEPSRIMENIARVSAHVSTKTHDSQPFLQLVETREGAPYLEDTSGNLWRVYAFIEGATMKESAGAPHEAAEAGRAVGEFQVLLADLSGPRLHEIIPLFHDTPSRFQTLHTAVQNDIANRVSSCRTAIDFALSCEPLGSRIVLGLEAGEIPERVVHNDAKMSNVLLDAQSGRALCVVDLDTVMPGSTLYDFGDMMRTMLCAAPEDERDLNRVVANPAMFEALAAGYLGAARSILNDAEIALLVYSGVLISLETGVRFLTDHLDGDRYFRVHRKNQNLDRAQAQFALVRSIMSQRAEFEAVVQRLASAAT